MKILLIEDDLKISQFLQEGLQQSGYVVETATDGEFALELLSVNAYDLIVCDVMLPKIDGIKVVETYRRTDSKTPILFLSAKRTVDDRILGLQSGGDDYLTKPFSLSELLARVQALLRRTTTLTSEPQASSTVLTGGDISIDLLRREVVRGTTKIDLQLKEFSLLEYFLRNQGRVLSKAQILERIWNYQFDPQTNVVDVLVFRLRSKIDKDFDRKHIQNIRGVGYVFQPD